MIAAYPQDIRLYPGIDCQTVNVLPSDGKDRPFYISSVLEYGNATERILSNFAAGLRGHSLKFNHLGYQREGVRIQVGNPLSG